MQVEEVYFRFQTFKSPSCQKYEYFNHKFEKTHQKYISQMDGQTSRWSFSIIFCLGITKLKTCQSY